MSLWDRIVPTMTFFLTSFLVLFPIGVIIYQSFLSAPIYEPDAVFTVDKYRKILTDPVFHSILINTIVIGLLAAIVAVSMGVMLAIIVERTDIPFKNAIRMAVILPIIMPLIVAAVAWTLMFGQHGYITLLLKNILGFAPWNINTLWGVGIVIGLYYAPYPFLFASSALSLSNPELEDVARTCGAGAFKTIRKITIPLLKPVIIYSALLIFVIGIEQLSIPLILGSPYGVEVLMTYLYEISIRSVLRDWPAAGVISVIVLIITTTLIFVLSMYVGAERRYISVGGKAIKPRLLKLGKWKLPTLVFVIAYTLFTTIIPTLGIVLRAFVKVLSPQISPWKTLTLSNFDFLKYSEYLMSIPNTVIVAAVGATLGTFYALYNSSTAKRTKFKLRGVLEHISLYPRGVPGLVLGMGFLWMFLLLKPLQLIRPTLASLIIAYIARYIPYGYTSVTPALMRVSEELDWSARVSGATWNYTLRRILMPILKPSLLATWLLLFITFLREYATAIFIYVPDTRVLGVTILEFWNQGEFGPIAALSFIQLLLVFASFIILQKILKVRLYA